MGDSCCNSASIGYISSELKKALPGVFVHSIATGSRGQADDTFSGFFGNVNSQVEEVCKLIAGKEELQHGYNAVGFSQGGQFLRAVAERCQHSGPRMHTLITLGAQHQGVMNVPECWNPSFNMTPSPVCGAMQSLLGLGAYLPYIRDHVIQAQYFKDPYHLDKYLAHNPFLPDINNELDVQNLQYKANLLTLDRLVLFRFKDDVTVIPRDSAWFGFFDGQQLLPMEQTPLYKDDWIGLRALDESGRLQLGEVPGKHMQFSWDWFMEHVVQPYLAEPVESLPRWPFGPLPLTMACTSNRTLLRWVLASAAMLLLCASTCQASPAISIIDGNTVSAEGAGMVVSTVVQAGENPVCAKFNYMHPGSRQAVVDYANAATSSDPATSDGCWLAYKNYCKYTNFTATANDAARTNWTANMQTLKTLVSASSILNPILLAPDCSDVLKHADQTNNLLGLLPSGASQCPWVDDGVNAQTPKSKDWRALGKVGPVTNQAGGTCFAHAAANFLTTQLIGTQIPGKTALTNATNISPQPLIDCYASGDVCSTGGFADATVNFFRDRPQTTIDIFPYATTQATGDGKTAVVAGCHIPDNPHCSQLTADSPNSYLLPANLATTVCSLSESQLVQSIALYGPTIVTLAVHPNFQKWKYDPSVGSVSYPGAGNDNTLAKTDPALPTDWCNPTSNHAVLAVGYVLDGPNSYLIIKNSWGPNLGKDGYWHLTLSDPSSPTFSDANFGGTCGVAAGVTILYSGF
ncbi:hypothetical protein WJX72_004713 [[Myrmecia] bisecta]|uniref:Palmitoyl-protein thioesterase 1 n=1 Tax=[Myrmecia] bisecta TaxID=41462 RepID=A0AAW1R6L0_9CHLO